MRKLLIFGLFSALLLTGCASTGGNGNTATNEQANADVEKLHALFDDAWERDLRENPISATYQGDKRFNDTWGEFGFDVREEQLAGDREILARLDTIDRAALPEDEQLNYDLFRKEYQSRIESYGYNGWLIPLNQRGGIQTLGEMTHYMSFATVRDYEDWIARIKSFDELMDWTLTVMQRGVDEGWAQPRIINKRILPQVQALVIDDPTKSDFYSPFREMPERISDADKQRLRSEAARAIKAIVIPAYAKMATFMEETYLPASRPAVGAWSMPGGREYYAWRTREYTTTDLTPDEIHDIGLSEVKRIRGEMMKIIKQVGFKGSFNDFLEFLRTDPQFYYDDPQELLEAYRAISKEIDPKLVPLFGKLPRIPYGVEPIPDAIAPDTTTAYYMPPAPDGSRAGTYFVNLYKPESRPTYEMPVLSVHEAVPGHHLQIALAQELGDLPNFRRYGGFTAFVEGWGLYSESLGEEMGLYEDPYDKFGQLTYEMWRAVRLVVDTGMHYKEWTRDEAIDFFMANAPKSELDIVNEIDRYIAWPGQALAYKIGELRIKELRARAENALGDDFDIKGFHDTVLGSGAIPLDILERNVDAWIATQK
jgi:prolyl oligopeptidase